jgi:hypothetical protein
VYIAALVGFVVFYGLEHLVGQRKTAAEIVSESGGEYEARLMHPTHVGGFALYNLLVGYLLIEWGDNPMALALYSAALGLHFLVTDDGMRRDYGSNYDRYGRHLMAGSVLAGAALASIWPVPVGLLTIVVGVVAGGVVINSMKDELPPASGGRFLPFLVGSVSYTVVILIASKMEIG